MNKKMKGVSLVSTPYVPYVDTKANSKHQALFQDYLELQEETMAARNKLETMKQRKLTLSAEVRFLRRRYKYLLENKAEKPSQVQKPLESKPKKKVSEKNCSRKEPKQRKQASAPEVNHQERIFNAKATNHRNPVPVLDLNQKDRMQNRKEASLINSTSLFDLNHNQRTHGAKEFMFLSPRPVLDLNQKESTAWKPPSLAFDLNKVEISNTGREDKVPNRAPIFDLNQISGEEELQDNYEPVRMEEPKMFLTRGGAEEQLNDMKLSVCRNVGNGPNRAVKRKVSWLDQVALKV